MHFLVDAQSLPRGEQSGTYDPGVVGWYRISQLRTARSWLYRSQLLQVNTLWKALDEIYKIYMLLHRSEINISENFRQIFSHFFSVAGG